MREPSPSLPLVESNGSTLLGAEAVAGFSATTVTRLLQVWQEEYRASRKQPLNPAGYTYIWADGVHFGIRLEEDKRLAALVIITVKARTRVTKGAGSRDAGLAMAFKLLTQAENRWRRVNSTHLVALVHAGVKFPDGQTRILPDMLSDSVVNQTVDATSELAIHNI